MTETPTKAALDEALQAPARRALFVHRYDNDVVDH